MNSLEPRKESALWAILYLCKQVDHSQNQDSQSMWDKRSEKYQNRVLFKIHLSETISLASIHYMVCRMQLKGHRRFSPLPTTTRSLIILTGPGKQCFTARKMFEEPWPSPRGNPVVYVSMSWKERHKMLRGYMTKGHKRSLVIQRTILWQKCKNSWQQPASLDHRLQKRKSTTADHLPAFTWYILDHLLNHMKICNREKCLSCLWRFNVFYSVNKPNDCCQYDNELRYLIEICKLKRHLRVLEIYTYGVVQ